MSTRLAAACADGDAARVHALLAGGADPNEAFDVLGTTPVMVASTLDVLDLLLDGGARFDSATFGRDVLDVVVSEESRLDGRAERVAAAQRLVARGAPLERRDANGWGRLYRAAFGGDGAAVTTLLALGADPDDEPSPLAAACWRQAPADDAKARLIVEQLVAAGADVHRRDDAGWHLLHAAAMPYSHGAGYASSDGPNLPAITALTAAGAAPDVVGPGGTTALMLVAEDGALDALQTLLALGADPAHRDDAGQRALDRAEDAERRLTEVLATASGASARAVSEARDRVRRCAEVLRT